MNQVGPSKKIEALKRKTRTMNNDNEQYKSLVERLNNKNIITSKLTVGKIKYSRQAHSDKNEIVRDLATYESYFTS